MASRRRNRAGDNRYAFPPLDLPPSCGERAAAVGVVLSCASFTPPPPPLLVLSTTVGREEREMRTGGEEVDAVTVTVTVTLARYRSLLLRERRGERWGDELGRGLR